MNDDMASNESMRGISRSGRVRKKSAKLIEMEDHGSPFYELEHGTEGQQQQPQQQQQTQPQRKSSHKKPPSGGKVGAVSPGIASSQFQTQSETTKVSSKRKPTSCSSPVDGRVQSSSSSSFQSKMEQRVIAIKQVDPPATFEALSGSAYLIGDDVHFITGEPIDSEGEDVTDNSGVGEYLSPLKIDVGGSVDIASLHDESGLKMKFILSPKPSSKSEGRSGHSKKKSSGKSGSKRSSSGGGSKSKKKKKKKESPESVMPVLEALAAGGIPNPAFALDSDSDDLGESRLIIAEPPVLQPMVSIGKSKKKSSSGDGHHGMGLTCKLKQKNKKSGSSKSSKHEMESGSANTEGVGQQQSLYLKEKNTSKKKASKKTAKTKDKPGGKVRPASAYMLWCRENRTRIVSENPGMDFAAISRRLGEDWQSLSEFEKMSWRRKAKAQGSMKSSNVIKTGKKPSESSSERATGGKVVPKHIVNAARTEDVSVLSKEVHRAVGTTPLDVAAHLKLLGESLSIIGQRLTEHMGQIAVSGSLSVLLDSTLCALAPLICLTSEVDQLDGCPKQTQERILDHIAYIMPGL